MLTVVGQHPVELSSSCQVFSQGDRGSDVLSSWPDEMGEGELSDMWAGIV